MPTDITNARSLIYTSEWFFENWPELFLEGGRGCGVRGILDGRGERC